MTAQRDAVDVAANALMDAHFPEPFSTTNPAATADRRARARAAIAEALRSASNSGAEAMREAAAKAAAQYCTKSFDDASLIAHSIRALPLPAPGAPASPWRDMKTAPKTGERILATGGGLGRQVEVVTWNERIGCWNAETCTLDDLDNDPDGYNRPTLWQPLPTPPASKDT